MDWSSRYATPLTAVFSREHKLSLEHRVEAALLRALEAEGLAPAGAAAEAEAAAAAGAAGGVLLARTLAIEKETHHDIMAMVKALAEGMPTAGGWVHYGATSQDVNDSVTALQLAECTQMLLASTRAVRVELTRLAVTHRSEFGGRAGERGRTA